MNIYLLFALAFGTLTGVTEVRVRREPVSIVRAERRAPIVARRSPIASRRFGAIRFASRNEGFAAVDPLTSSLSPRAPAVNC
jgi:hypothetical protein